MSYDLERTRVKLDVAPIPESFRAYQPQPSLAGTFRLISELVGMPLGTVPESQADRFVDSVFSLAFQMFPFETVMQARNFQKFDVVSYPHSIAFYWNYDLSCGCALVNGQKFWTLPLTRVSNEE